LVSPLENGVDSRTEICGYSNHSLGSLPEYPANMTFSRFMEILPTGRSARLGFGLAFGFAATSTLLLQAQVSTNELASALEAEDIRPRLRNVTVYGDYLQGLGHISLPVGYALDGTAIGRTVASPDRESTYYGGSVSWQAFERIGFDIAYTQGTSSGNFTFKPEQNGRWPEAAINSTFTLDDTWLQAYMRYKLPPIFGRGIGLYLRGGVTYMDAEYEGRSEPLQAFYINKGSIRDITGNVGFGIDYGFRPIKGIRPLIVFEGEGFGGVRSREFSEQTLPISGSNSMDNMVFGGLVRLLVRAEYRFGKGERWRAMLEGGVQARMMFESYGTPSDPLFDDRSSPNPVRISDDSFVSGTKSDLLWGPYVRAGLRYSF
jgi:hypothetical protein